MGAVISIMGITAGPIYWIHIGCYYQTNRVYVDSHRVSVLDQSSQFTSGKCQINSERAATNQKAPEQIRSILDGSNQNSPPQSAIVNNKISLPQSWYDCIKIAEETKPIVRWKS